MMEENKQSANPEQKIAEPTVNEHIGLIASANAAADRIEKANRDMDALLKKQELILQEQRLSGGTYAGQTPVVKVETAVEYKDRIMRGG